MMQIKVGNCENCNLKKKYILGPQTFHLRPLSLLLDHIVAFFVSLFWPYFDEVYAFWKSKNDQKSLQVV